ncbi:hypothetical protein CVT26_011608 [Gymnopilus dilepis]|uniref:F-box domain-containing protein n=1 Tax=Gymnopilus dilepis TaxID=231916 RepID=A0A409YQQ9_9AGAR|nr:hypothetical protein CVT26_011608 [Gymnopilus dilepis]
MVYYGGRRLRCEYASTSARAPSVDTPVFVEPRLPPELFQPIVSFVTSRNTLYSLCLTSQTLRYYAERCLYSAISVPDASNAPLHVSFLGTITQNPRLARLVKEYYSLSIVVYQENPLWGLTKRALKAMTGLKVLVFRGFGGHPSGELLDFGDSGPPFQLQKLHWGNHSDERFMERILVQQGNSLRELSFECRPHPAPFPLQACPDLDCLYGNRAAIEALLPGRKVTRLSWVPELDDSNADPVVGLDKELSALRTLSFGGYFSRPKLELIAQFLERLEVLELVGLSYGEFSLLKNLPSLRELVFSLRWGIAQFPIPLKGRQQAVEELFKDCPKLTRVDVVHEWLHVEVDTIMYQRWERGGGEPRFLTRAEVREGRF